MNLYEITREIEVLDELLDSIVDYQTGEVEEQDLEAYEKLEEEVRGLLISKSSGIIKFVRNKQSNVDSLKDEIKRLTALKKVSENKILRLKNYVMDNMQKLEVKKIETEIGNISLRKGVKSLVIKDLGAIDDSYIEFTKKAKTSEIKALLKNGVAIEGAELVEGNPSLTIR